MAEAFLKSIDPKLEVISAGTNPATRVSSRAIQAMKEIGIDMNGGFPKSVDQFIGVSFDYVITVCDHAKEACPVFSGAVGQRLHIGFDDPTIATGTEEEVLNEFRRVRDEIKIRFIEFYNTSIKH
jgi:arsenate reductase (thioredoxin)